MVIPKEYLEILPFALAAAVSPILFTFALLVSGQKDKSFLKSMLFLLGSAITIFAIGFVLFFFLSKISPSSTFTSKDAWLDLIIGIALVLFALKQLFFKKQKKATKPKTLSIVGSFFLGLVLMLSNSSTIIMFFPAAHVASFYSINIKIELLLIMVIFSLIPAIAPPVILKVIRSQKTIDSIKSFINSNGSYIIAVVFGILGILEIVKSLRFWF
jgi:hypothetical protein